jgi:hypothetical protein
MRLNTRHGWSVVVIVGAAVLALGSGKKPSSDETTNEKLSVSGKTEKQSAKPAAAAKKKLGESVLFDDSEWVVLEAKDMGNKVDSNNPFDKAAKSEDGKFIRVKFSVKNKGKKEEMLFDQPKLIDGEGREFGHHENETSYVPKDSKTLALEKIPVGLKKEFWTVYEVPTDAKNLKFETRALEIGGDKVAVDLGI